jgi:hypothetical protein
MKKMKKAKQKILAFSVALALSVSWSKAATVNLSLTVAPEDGFSLRDNLGNFLPETAIVKIGYFYDPTTGNSIDGTAIAALYNSAASFSAGNSALLGKFLEIGSAQIGVNSINGLEAGFLAGDQDRPYGTATSNSARVDDNGSLIQGSFFRGWMDGTLPIQTSGTSPFNSITNVKLTGAFLSVIAYNNESLSSASQLLVARSLSALPTSDEATSFALGASTSELLIGSSVANGYQTVPLAVPEPSSTLLVGAASIILMAYRRRTSVNL